MIYFKMKCSIFKILVLIKSTSFWTFYVKGDFATFDLHSKHSISYDKGYLTPSKI